MSTTAQNPVSEKTPFDFSSPLMFCSRCRAQIRETDNYCYNCGKSLKKGYGFLYTHTGIILMSLVLGPFSLPFVWLSKRINLVSKIIYTLLLFALGYYLVLACVQAYASLQDAMKSLSNIQNISNMPGFTSITFDSF